MLRSAFASLGLARLAHLVAILGWVLCSSGQAARYGTLARKLANVIYAQTLGEKLKLARRPAWLKIIIRLRIRKYFIELNEFRFYF